MASARGRDPKWWLPAVLIISGAVWFWASSGFLSSNDGSHVALSRALVLRGETPIDPDVALTLFVDRAKLGEHDYSDRPPGTAAVATPAAWVGNQLDPRLMRRSLQSRELVFTPAAPNFAQTYEARVRRLGVAAPALLALQGTALCITTHAIVVGLAGLACVWVLLARRGVSLAAKAFAVATLGLATLWGPYGTALFSHGTAGALLIAHVLALDFDDHPQARAFAIAAGVCGAGAVAADYALVFAIVPLAALLAPRRLWPWVLFGAAPVAAATMAYHAAAFGSPWSIGYDFHTNFAFARERASTFSGNPLGGVWTLWGLGRDAGVLAQSPVVLVGVAGLAMAGRATPGALRLRRTLLALAPWLLLLCFHRTPWGGATVDHRYLVPALPLFAAGLGVVWQRLSDRSRLVRAALVALALGSAALTWTHFFEWRG